MTQALVLAGETKHVPTQAYALTHAAILEMTASIRRARHATQKPVSALAHEHGLKLWTVVLPVDNCLVGACI